MPTEIIQTKGAPGAIGPYSQGVVAHHFLYSAGQVGLDPATGELVSGGISAQTTRALQNLAGVLAERGLGWHDVVKTTVFLQNMTDFQVMNDAYGKVLGDARPARSTVQVAGLPRGAAVEIELIAALKKKPE
jgi:2-iminobutanoate/2-iminopropanoate deaminase